MLADLGTFEICASKYMSLILLIFIPPQDQMAGSFKKDLKKVDLLTYICDALLMVEKGIRSQEESVYSSICKS